MASISWISALSQAAAPIASVFRAAVPRGVSVTVPVAAVMLGGAWLAGSSPAIGQVSAAQVSTAQVSTAQVSAAQIQIAQVSVAQTKDQDKDGSISAIGVIDVQSVLRQSLAARSIQEQIDTRREAYQAQVSEEERALREAEQDLARKRAILSVEDYQAAVRDFQAGVADIQRKVQSRKRGLDEAFAKAMSEVRQKMVSAVAEIAEERGYDLVLFKNQIVIAAKSLDITEEVRRRLDEALPRVEVELPPDE